MKFRDEVKFIHSNELAILKGSEIIELHTLYGAFNQKHNDVMEKYKKHIELMKEEKNSRKVLISLENLLDTINIVSIFQGPIYNILIRSPDFSVAARIYKDTDDTLIADGFNNVLLKRKYRTMYLIKRTSKRYDLMIEVF